MSRLCLYIGTTLLALTMGPTGAQELPLAMNPVLPSAPEFSPLQPDQQQFTEDLVTLQLLSRQPTITADELAQQFERDFQLGNWTSQPQLQPSEAAAKITEQFGPLVLLEPFAAPVYEAEVLLGVKDLPSESTLISAWTDNLNDMKRAHEMGNLNATTLLGEAFLKGRGVEANTETGLQLLQRAVAAGVPQAFTIQGQFLLQNSGDNQDQRNRALQLLQGGLQRGDANAALPLALNDLARLDTFDDTVIEQRAIHRLAISTQYGTGAVPSQATMELSAFCGKETYVCEPLNVAIAVAREVQLSPDGSVQTFTDRQTEDYVPVFTGAVATFPLRKDDAPPPFPGIVLDIGAEATPSVQNDLSKYVGGLVDQNDFLEAAVSALTENPNERILLYVHGFNNSVEDALTGIVRLKLDGQLPGLPMIYSWAAGKDILRFNGSNLWRPAFDGYGHDIQIASSSCQQFRTFLLALSRAIDPERIILFGHSHGAKLVHAALTDCEFRGETPERFPGRFDNVVYAAPDIDNDQFLQSFQQLGNVASKVTVYASDKDFALDASTNFARGGLKRLGVGGPAMTVVAGIDSVDASQLPGIGDAEFGHAYAFLDETVMADIKATLEGATQHLCRAPGPGDGFILVDGCF